jgi:hypothetical protein
MLANAATAFDEQGTLLDPVIRSQVSKYIADFSQFVVRLAVILGSDNP